MCVFIYNAEKSRGTRTQLLIINVPNGPTAGGIQRVSGGGGEGVDGPWDRSVPQRGSNIN